MKKLLSGIIILALLLVSFSGCSSNKTNNNHQNGNSSQNIENNNNSTNNASKPQDVDFSSGDDEMFTDRDNTQSYDTSKAITVSLNNNTAVSSSNSVKISGGKVTITEEATYIISGKLTDGMLIVNAKDTAKIQLVLNGADITSKSSAALYVLGANKVFVTLADGTNNTLANGGSFTEVDDNNIDAALFSKQDLTLNGTGSLTVTSPAGHGIVCKDDLVITGGNYTVNSASHGIDANDSVRIANANFTIDAGKDGIRAENTEDTAKGFIYISGGNIKAEAEGDGISASAYIQILDGTINLTVGGGSKNGSKQSSDNFGGFMGGGRPGGMRPGSSQNTTTQDGTSMKGIKASNSLQILSGTFTINSADDSIHSNNSITINGGTFNISSGDDGIHADQTLTITAGKFDIFESYEGLEALHIDISGGDIKLKASDDGLNAAGGNDGSGTGGGRDGMFGGPGGFSSNSNGSIKISSATLYINASGDGLDANGIIEISGGNITVTGPTQGDTAVLDYDKSATITGATFIGTGSTMMAQSLTSSTQGVIAVKVNTNNSGTLISLENSSGDTVLTRTPELSFAYIVISTPEIKKGESYSITIGAKAYECKAN